MYCVRWTRDSSAFAEGWTIGCLDGEMLGYVTLDVGYRIRGVEDDSLAEAMWRDLKDMYPDVSFRGRSSLMAPAGEVHLSIFKVLDGQPGDVVRCLDSSIPTLAEAAFSLMSRYDREYPSKDIDSSVHAARYPAGAMSAFVRIFIPDAVPRHKQSLRINHSPDVRYRHGTSMPCPGVPKKQDTR